MAQIIESFVKAYADFETAAKAGNRQEADALYRKLYDIYSSIGSSGLGQEHSEIAYEQLKKAYEKLSGISSPELGMEETIQKPEPRKTKILPVDIIAAGIIIFVLGTILFVKPEIVGLSVFDGQQTVELRLSFPKSGTYALKLGSSAESLKVSGTAKGRGKLYAVAGGKKYLVLDTELLKGEFSDACIETCAGLRARDILLVAEIESGELYLSQLVYTLNNDANHAPEWIGRENLAVSTGKELAVDMAKMFTDSDGDDLTYLSTSTTGLEARVSGRMLYLTARTAGTKEITLMASDGEAVAKQTVKVVVA